MKKRYWLVILIFYILWAPVTTNSSSGYESQIFVNTSLIWFYAFVPLHIVNGAICLHSIITSVVSEKRKWIYSIMYIVIGIVYAFLNFAVCLMFMPQLFR